MPDISGTKISALDADSTITDSDYLAGVDTVASPIKSKKFTFAKIKSWIKSWIAAGDVTYDNTTSGLSADDVQEAIDALAQGGGATVDGGTISLPLSWSGSGPYTQTVTVTGATVTSNSLISLQPTAAQLESLITDGVTAITIENNAGTLTAYALGATPSTAMTIACTVTEVAT